MRLNHLRLFVCLVLGTCTLAPRSRAADDAAPPAGTLPGEAFRLSEVFRTEVAKTSQQYADAVKSLPTVQQSQLLALQKRLQESGDLDGYLATTKEVTRFSEALKAEPDPFEKVPELPESALVDKPDALRALQDQYLKAHKEKLDARKKRVEDIANGYVSQMEILQSDLTKKNRIHDAIAVKREIERIRKGLTDGTFVKQALSTPAAKPAAGGVVETASTNDAPVYGKVPEWAKWQFDRSDNFAGDGDLFAHPDLPDQLTIDFNPKVGRGRIYGRCEVERQVVDMRECAWFGKAIQWKVKDFSSLNTTILLQSKEIAAGQGYGPKAYLVLLGDKGPLGEELDVTMMWKDATLTIAKDADANRCTLGWIQGKIKKTVDLPASGSVRVLLGITLRNLGERCDTTITMQ